MSHTQFNNGKMVEYNKHSLVQSDIHIPELDCTVPIEVPRRSMPLIERIGLMCYLRRFGLRLEDVVRPEHRHALPRLRSQRLSLVGYGYN